MAKARRATLLDETPDEDSMEQSRLGDTDDSAGPRSLREQMRLDDIADGIRPPHMQNKACPPDTVCPSSDFGITGGAQIEVGDELANAVRGGSTGGVGGLMSLGATQRDKTGTRAVMVDVMTDKPGASCKKVGSGRCTPRAALEHIAANNQGDQSELVRLGPHHALPHRQ